MIMSGSDAFQHWKQNQYVNSPWNETPQPYKEFNSSKTKNKPGF